MPRWLRHFLLGCIKHNSLYLLSGLCILLGFFLSMRNTGLEGSSLPRELFLVGIFKSYEFLVVLAATVVFAALRVVNDGILLTCIGLVLALDPTFFAPGFYSHGLAVGLMVNGACLGLVALNLHLLTRYSKVPVSARASTCFMIAATFVYLAPAVVDMDGTSQHALVYLFSFGPLIIAMLARPWTEEGNRPGSDQGFWIYYRYLDTFLIFYPFLMCVEQVRIVSQVVETPLHGADYAPMILGAFVLLFKVFPKWFEADVHWVVVPGWLVTFLSFDHPAALDLPLAGGLHIGPPALMAGVALILSLALHVLVRRSSYLLWNATLLSTLLIALVSPGAVMTNITEPSWLLMLPTWLMIGYQSRRFGSFGLAAAHVLWTATLVVRATGLAGSPAWLVWEHLAGFGMIALLHLHPRSPGRDGSVVLASMMALYAFGTRGAFPGWETCIFLADLAAFFMIGRVAPHSGLRSVSKAFLGLFLVERYGAVLWQTNWSALAANYAGGTLMFAAFLCLFGGIFISFHKDRLIGLLEDPQEASPAE